jgi:hypothetical protein
MTAIDHGALSPTMERRRKAKEPPPAGTKFLLDGTWLFAFALYAAGVVAALAWLASF